MKYSANITEYDECISLVEWLKLNNIDFAHIHQEFYTKSWKQKMKAKKMGVQAGIPDYMVVYRGKLIFIEMKRRGGKISVFQKHWLGVLGKIKNVEAVVCFSAEEAINYLKSI